MDSLYSHARAYFTDKFGQPPMSHHIPEGLACKGVDIGGNAALLTSAEDAREQFEIIWGILSHAVAYDRCGISMWKPPGWVLRNVEGRIAVEVITEPDVWKVAQAIARTPAPEDVHPFADRVVPINDRENYHRIMAGLRDVAEDRVVADPGPTLHHRDRGIHAAGPTDAADPRSGREIMDRMHDDEVLRQVRASGAFWDTANQLLRNRGVPEKPDAALTQAARDFAFAAHAEGANRAEAAKDVAFASGASWPSPVDPPWGDLSDSELLQTLGTDAVAWAKAFAAIPMRLSLREWFANAIESGCEAGRTQPQCHPAEGYHKKPEGIVTTYDFGNDVFVPVTQAWVDWAQATARAHGTVLRDLRKALENYDLNRQEIDRQTKAD